MRFLKKAALLLLLPLLTFSVAHKFYLSVTTVQYSEKDQALQITSRIFVDDLERVLVERYGINPKLGTEGETDLAQSYLEKYLRTKLLVFANGKQQRYTYIGRQYEDDVVICYLEVPQVELKTLETVTIQNEVLTDLFGDQRNVVHFKIGDLKKSVILMKDKNKEMLKL
tara:strand:+ start:69968 stop:70474 length:507 start_codon:yes stop_codon:yes gene_type:complete